jgi:hypothetical protein
MHELITNPMVHAVALFAIAVAASKWLYRKDEKIEDQRRGAFKLAGEMRAKGMSWMPDLLEDYAVGDYDNIGTKLVKVGMLAHNDAALKAEFDTVFATLLKSKFQDADAKAQLEDLLEEAGHRLVPITPAPDEASILDKIHATVAAAVANPIKPSGT